MASFYLVFEKDFSQLHVVSDVDISNDGPLSLYHNNQLLGTFDNPSVGATFNTTLTSQYLRTTFGIRYIFTITPEIINQESFADGIWHVILKQTDSKSGTFKFECLYCALAKMLNGDCDITANETIVNKINAYMIVSQASVRVKNFTKAYRLYKIAKQYADPYNCSC